MHHSKQSSNLIRPDFHVTKTFVSNSMYQAVVNYIWLCIGFNWKNYLFKCQTSYFCCYSSPLLTYTTYWLHMLEIALLEIAMLESHCTQRLPKINKGKLALLTLTLNQLITIWNDAWSPNMWPNPNILSNRLSLEGIFVLLVWAAVSITLQLICQYCNGKPINWISLMVPLCLNKTFFVSTAVVLAVPIDEPQKSICIKRYLLFQLP